MRNSILLTMLALPLLAVATYAADKLRLLAATDTLMVTPVRIGAAVPISGWTRVTSPPTA